MIHGISAIVNFAFSRSFAEAIELKVKAEQEKLKAERDLQRIEVEAKQKVASARAEAEALALQRQQITPDLLALRRIENGEYGYCEMTGEPISLKRLDARPIATMTLEAQEKHERREKVHRDD